jgi:hypothetical protein
LWLLSELWLVSVRRSLGEVGTACAQNRKLSSWRQICLDERMSDGNRKVNFPGEGRSGELRREFMFFAKKILFLKLFNFF